MVIDFDEAKRLAEAGDVEGAAKAFAAILAAKKAEQAEKAKAEPAQDLEKSMADVESFARTLNVLCVQTIHVCGHEVTIDLTDADVLDRYEKARTYLPRELKNNGLTPGVGFGDTARKQCAIIEEYADIILGPGMAEKLFDGHRASLGLHWQFVSDVAKLSVTAMKTVNDERNKALQMTKAQEKKAQAQQFRNFAAQSGGNRKNRRRKR